MFDFSNYPKRSKVLWQSKWNGCWQNERGIQILINKFVGLKSKMHSLLSDDGKESNKAKGINTATKDTLFNKKVIRHKMKTIQSKKHKIGTKEKKSTKYNYSVSMIKDLF